MTKTSLALLVTAIALPAVPACSTSDPGEPAPDAGGLPPPPPEPDAAIPPGPPLPAGPYVYAGGTNFTITSFADPAAPVVAATYDPGPGVYIGDVVIDGPRALLAIGWQVPWELRIVDTSDPSHVTQVGSFVSDNANNMGIAELELEGTTAYFAHYSVLDIVDVADPAAPAAVGRFDFTGPARGLTIRDGLAYLLSEYFGLIIVDVHDPANPVELSTTITPYAEVNGGVGPWGLAIAGHYAYVVEPRASDRDGSGLLIYDVADPAAPVLVGTLGDVAKDGHEIVVAPDGHAYLARSGGGPRELLVVDVSDPTAPALVAEVPSAGLLPHGIAIDGTRVYLGGGDALYPWWGHGSLDAFDVTDPTAPVDLGHMDSLVGGVYQGVEAVTVTGTE